ncbi:MAG TPA: hypothetical protein VLZ89_07475 [Anaerolineales bacterium]|nr:hypothetical protein [Anaerolineales bacterium]
MMTKFRTLSMALTAVLLFAGLVTSACERTFSRSASGSLNVTTSITQQQLQSAIQSSLADPLITGLNAQLQSGYILVTGGRKRLNDASLIDTLTFRLDLGVANGHLTATVSDAQVDNIAVEAARVSVWNQTIANRLENLARRAPGAVLQSVSVTPASITLSWQLTK